MNADPLSLSLSSELDRGAIGHEPDRGGGAGVPCSDGSDVSVAPRNSVQSCKVCSGLCGRECGVRSRGM